MVRRTLLVVCALAALLAVAAPSQAKTLRLFAIGNSFSGNALTYLSKIAASNGDELVVKHASIGGCPLEKHWKGVAAYLADPEAKEGKVYGGKSLQELMGDTPWDAITIQQYSMYSSNLETYQPFATQLRDYVMKLQPKARLYMHQTWAYRVDSRDWGQVGGGKSAKDQAEMWEKSRAAYHHVADELGIPVLPVGDAFQAVHTDPKWCYHPDPAFDPKTAVEPQLPDQSHSLHVGYRWKAGKLSFDSHHANAAGCYLAGLVWYAVLFDASPEKVTFAPPEVAPDFAAHLRRVAAEVVQAGKEK